MMRFSCVPPLRCCRPWPLQQASRGEASLAGGSRAEGFTTFGRWCLVVKWTPPTSTIPVLWEGVLRKVEILAHWPLGSVLREGFAWQGREFDTSRRTLSMRSPFGSLLQGQ